MQCQNNMSFCCGKITLVWWKNAFFTFMSTSGDLQEILSVAGSIEEMYRKVREWL